MIRDNLARVRERIAAAVQQSGRSSNAVRLVAVSKRKSADDIRRAYEAGQRDFGENYVQEAVAKISELKDCEICWHCIGHVQTNKLNLVKKHFNFWHTLENIRQLTRLSKANDAQSISKVLIEVNMGNEPSKSGIPADRVDEFVQEVEQADCIDVNGLMTIPPIGETMHYAALRKLQDHINAMRLKRVRIDELSMGMTDDFEDAIKEGATIVRVGRAIFGERQ